MEISVSSERFVQEDKRPTYLRGVDFEQDVRRFEKEEDEECAREGARRKRDRVGTVMAHHVEHVGTVPVGRGELGCRAGDRAKWGVPSPHGQDMREEETEDRTAQQDISAPEGHPSARSGSDSDG